MTDPSDDKTLSTDASHTSFSSIGPYRLVQMIGAGGMGEVWRAEQVAPFRRTVALKLIKAGTDTRAALARFESERQALALMEHPNIAKVFDAGATPEGRPYFVMECVPGLPITGYCDRHRLTIHERLALFMQVCEGVQHAHQKAVIHRDLKPSNVLVTDVDQKPVPKTQRPVDRAAVDRSVQFLRLTQDLACIQMLVGSLNEQIFEVLYEC